MCFYRNRLHFEKFSNNEQNQQTLLNILDRAFGDEFSAIREKYIESLELPSNVFYVVYHGKRVGTFEIKGDGFLASFGILPEYQNKGIGSDVIAKLSKQYPKLRSTWNDNVDYFYRTKNITRVIP